MPARNGQASSQPGSDDAGANGSADAAASGPVDLPGLTVGQRLLLKLPDLGRNKSARSRPATTGPQMTSGRPGTSQRPKAAVPKPAPKKAPASTSRADDTAAATQSRDTDESVEATAAGHDDAEPGRDIEVADAELVDAEDTGPDEPDAEDTGARDTGAEVVATPKPAARGSARAPRPSQTALYDKMPTSELTVLMRKLDDKERLLTFIASPLGAVLALVLTFITLSHNPALHHTGHEASSVIVTDGAIGVGFSIIVAVMAWFRRRSLTAFSLLFLGYSLGLIGIGIPFLFLGGYLLFRAWRIQKVLTSRGVSTRPPSRRGAAARSSASDPKARRDPKGSATAGKTTRPTASKRYTPPKPPPKRPPVAKPEKAGS